MLKIVVKIVGIVGMSTESMAKVRYSLMKQKLFAQNAIQNNIIVVKGDEMNTKEIIDSLESIQNNLREQKESLLKLKEVCTDVVAPTEDVVGQEVPYEIIETEDDHHYFLEVYAKLPNGKKAYQSAIRIEKKIFK